MTWTKLSDDHFDREEIFSLSRSAVLLDIEAKVWCNRLGTDGHVPASMLARLTTSTDPQSDVAELVAGHVWEVDGNGWQVDWSEQRTKADVDADREAGKVKQAAYRDRVKRHGAGDHSACHPKHCPALSNPKLTGSVTGLVSPPDLTCPDPDLTRPEGSGSGSGSDAHATPSAREPHWWISDGSDISCAECGLPASHGRHFKETMTARSAQA